MLSFFTIGTSAAAPNAAAVAILLLSGQSKFDSAAGLFDFGEHCDRYEHPRV